jgi:dipeptidyl aminopeptidase/acylaminoacyl peptidase
MRATRTDFPSGLLLVFLATVLLAAAGCRRATDAGVVAPIATYPAAAFHETVSVSGSSFSADESRVLLTSDETGVFNVYSQPLDGSAPQPLTESTTESNYGLTWFPADDRFLYRADQGGNELDHLYVRELDGSIRDLTPGDGLKAQFMGFSGDKKSFHVATNERDAQAFDVYRYSVDGYERQLVFENDGSFFPGDVSRDGRYLALTKMRNNADSDVYVADLGSGQTSLVTAHEGDVANSPVTFSPDSSELYYSTNGEGEFAQVWAYGLESQERRPMLVADWDVQNVTFSESGRYRVTSINQDASTQVSILDRQTEQVFELPGVPAGDLSDVNFSPSEARVAFYVSSDTAPRNLYVYDIGGEQARRLTQTLNPAIEEDHLVESEVVRYESYDGLEIPAILWRPKGASASSRVPALVWVHGGPGGQSRRGYNATFQHLLNHGYAILAVNNRGSSGYGKTFYHLDDRKHGDADLKDCVAARGYLEGLDWVEGDRIGIIGGSYGGYMVAAALAFEPEVFDVGVDIFGVTNWLRTLQEIPPWWGAQRDSLYTELGDPSQEEERLRAISPLFHASNITKPLLVIQGANDPRVQQVESDELVAAVRANGVPVEYVLFPDEGHGFSKKNNRVTASEAYLTFLDQYLKGETPTT